MCRPIFGTGKADNLNSGFCMAKVITYLELKGVYDRSLIKKQRSLTKGNSGELIETHFQDKEVSDVRIIEKITQDNKYFRIFCMKDPYSVMNIMATWITINELESENRRRNFI